MASEAANSAPAMFMILDRWLAAGCIFLEGDPPRQLRSLHCMLGVMLRPLKWGFVVRGGALAILCLALAALVGVRLAFPPVPYGLPPPPPQIPLPSAEPPAGAAGLQLWARYGRAPAQLVGSAFVLALPDGRAVGVSAAHNLSLDDPKNPLVSLELRIATSGSETGSHEEGTMAVVGLLGEPGRARRFGLDLAGDHVLLRLAPGAGAEIALPPDPRGGSQPGERILLIGGIDGSRHSGSVFQADASGIWCLMDGDFEAGLLSGSPVISLHTGEVVGMALAAGRREGRLVLGMHPIGPLIELAELDDTSGQEIQKVVGGLAGEAGRPDHHQHRLLPGR